MSPAAAASVAATPCSFFYVRTSLEEVPTSSGLSGAPRGVVGRKGAVFVLAATAAALFRSRLHVQ